MRLRRRNHLGARRDHDVGPWLRQVRTLVGLRLFYRRRRVDYIWLGDRYRLGGLHRSVFLQSRRKPVLLEAYALGSRSKCCCNRATTLVSLQTCFAQGPLPVRSYPAPMSILRAAERPDRYGLSVMQRGQLLQLGEQFLFDF